MSRDGERRFGGDTQPLPVAKDTKDYPAVYTETVSFDAGKYNVEQLKMEHLKVFKEMTSELVNYVIQHTGRFGAFRRDATPSVVQQFEIYIQQYYTALHQYEETTVSEDPRAHRLDIGSMQRELQQLIQSVCQSAVQELLQKKHAPNKDDIQERLTIFQTAMEQQIFTIISQLVK